jgi:hypothetical protein
MIQNDFPRTPSPVYQKTGRPPGTAQPSAATQNATTLPAQQSLEAPVAHRPRPTSAHAQAAMHMHAQTQLLPHGHARGQHATQPSPMYYPDPLEAQQLSVRMHNLTVADTVPVRTSQYYKKQQQQQQQQQKEKNKQKNGAIF